MPSNGDCIPIALAYLECDGQVLLSRRPAGVHQGGRWEFPGGKVAAGEAFPAALVRELWEEVGVTIRVDEELAVTRYRYTDRCVELHLFRCTLLHGDPAPREVAEVRWAPVETLHTYDFPPANAALLRALRLHE